MDLFDKLERVGSEAKSIDRWEGTFREFLQKFSNERDINSNMGVLAHQRIYNMIMSAGSEQIDHFGQKRTQYSFFENSIYGVEESVDDLMSYFHSAAQKTETSRRMLLMYGPPSSGKSSLVQKIKEGLEQYTKIPEGAIYALKGSSMHENPFLLIPNEMRSEFEQQYGLGIEGTISPLVARRLEDEFSGNFMEYPVEQIFLSEAARRGIGTWLPQDPKCVTPYFTRVYSNGIKRLSEIHREISETSGFDSEGFGSYQCSCEGKGGLEDIKGMYDNGLQPVYEIDYGLQLQCTNNHRLLTLDSNGDTVWRQLKDINIGESILVKCGMNSFGDDMELPSWEGKKMSMNPKIGYIVGSLVAESSHSRNTVYYHNKDHNLNVKFSQAVKNEFLFEPSFQYEYVKDGIRVTKTGDSNLEYQTACAPAKSKVSSISIRIHAKLGKWLLNNFDLECGACEKQVPNCILQASRSTQIEFLEGIFLGDGSIRYKKNKVARFTYGTCSQTLAIDVQSMLLNLGIYSRMHTARNKKYSDNLQYSVCVEGEDVYGFVDLFPKFVTHRQFEKREQDHKCRYEYFGSLSELIREIRKYTSGTRNLIDRRYTISGENSRTPTRITLVKWLAELDNIEWTDEAKKQTILAKIKNILNYKCVSLKKKKYIGMKHVVDLSCNSKLYSYVTNGAISHNSSDQSELVGGIDFSKIQEFGDEADPRTYNFNGELNVANRGIMEFIEGLKADERFLRVLLTATQEKAIKAPRFGLIYCDVAIIMHSNEEEFKTFMSEKKYEAYHDRMVIVKVPYIMSVQDEVKIYEKLLASSDALKNMNIAPKTLTAAAMFAVLTRLTPPTGGGDLTLIKKMKLYDNQHVKGYKVEQVPAMKRKHSHEGMSGISPRFVIDQISAAIAHAREDDREYLTALDVLRQLNRAIDKRDSYGKETKNHYEALSEMAREEWDEMLKNDIQKAFFVSYESEARNLCENYLDHIQAACSGEKPRDPVTGDEIEVDEKLMNSIEEQINISDSGKEDFRNEILRAVALASRKGKRFDYTRHADLKTAIQKKLFEERKNIIRMTVSTRNPDKEELKKINDVVARMVDQQGYSAGAANALLKYATSHLFDK